MTPATPHLDAERDTIFDRFTAVGEDLSKTSERDRTIVAVYGAQGVIDNGGLKYSCENNWPGTPAYRVFVDAYRRVGAGPVADVLERAVARFPFPNPHAQQELRLEFMASLDDSDPFFGEAACDRSDVWGRLEDYVRSSAQQE